MKKKIKVNYRQNWSDAGTHYTQTIYLSKKFVDYINLLIRDYHNSSYENKEILASQVGFSIYYDMYLEEIDLEKGYYFMNITQLKFIYYYLNINNYDTKRILYRNTMLKVV